jgi:hypothetical protein
MQQESPFAYDTSADTSHFYDATDVYLLHQQNPLPSLVKMLLVALLHLFQLLRPMGIGR